MATTAKSKTTKTKSAQKPATKPAGTSVKPKQTKTVKTTKAASKSTTTNAKTTKTHTKNRASEIFFGIIMIVLALAIIAGVATYCILGSQKNNTVMVETGKGNHVSTTMTELPNSKASILIPNDFKKLNDDELKELKTSNDAEDANIKVAYANADKSVIIYMSESSDETSNDEIKQGITELAKIFKATGIKDITTNVKEVGNHNVGTVKFSGLKQAAYPYQYIALFSDNNKAVSIAFGCSADATAEWTKVGDAIIDSLNFRE